ncbi:MAG: (2Fe-2S) ferredoxin domain-containing protein [Anaeromicrobium sp.]|jgi:NADP-reducing hydrogenase subunit HndB|uniref:(2Fe-2S) ferredoxin domain-containing protein n=1 Tax=Anaeromicrobium sp. TaxID=1929132 RepID=UPI0025F11B0F|nr:(2Fe-2S) ferredoxin domain-containing protein [Anaeromicrobium sp.]MCT4595774.1 (2Fe-2S) ferredoxin domain-containing protein [Anaeromicrobium sp.]
MKSLEELGKIREEARNKIEIRDSKGKVRIVVGMATCGISAGARPVLLELINEVNKRGLKDVVVSQTGCIGVCRLEPIVEVYKSGENKVTYVEMTPGKAQKIIVEHIVNGNVVDEYTIGAVK